VLLLFRCLQGIGEYSGLGRGNKEWRKPHNEEHYHLYCSLNIIKSRIMRWAGYEARMGREEAYTGFCWGNLRGKKPLGRPKRRSENNIKMDLQEVGYGGMDWIDLAQARDRWRVIVNAVMNLHIP
jgi:hypothetical protein